MIITTPTITEIQEEYVKTINNGYARWSHRPKQIWQTCGGQFSRIDRGARHKAVPAPPVVLASP